MSRVTRAVAGARAAYAVAPMTAHDLLEVVEIEAACGLSLWGWDAYHAELDRPESIMLVARGPAPDASGRWLGGFVAVRLAAGELHVNNIGVRATVRQRGLGSALLGAALSTGAGAGAGTAVLEVRAGNLAAQALYRRFGFGVTGQRRHYYRAPVEDALIMWTRLGTGP